MKIKTKNMPYSEVLKLPRPERQMPTRPNPICRKLARMLSKGDLKATQFTYTEKRMDELKKQPSLILMNHSSFLDLEIAEEVFKDMPFCIVCTSDGFVGKSKLLRSIGCFPTNKFVPDVTLIRDIQYIIDILKVSVLMYPEASYSFDGTATTLPRKLGVLLKRLKAPVVSVITEGSFSRDPLYNCLQKRNVKVSAEVEYLLTPEEIAAKSISELDDIIDAKFTFDAFAWQRDNKVAITEDFRADGLERILYTCPHCMTEGEMEGKGTKLRCNHCGAEYTLDEYGVLQAENPAFTHVPDWYKWERELVRKELTDGSYKLDIHVNIGVLVNEAAIYMIGGGRLIHDENGFHLESDDKSLVYDQKPLASYSLYSDYYWYEIGDMICIGDNDKLYYCFPEKGVPVAKARLAAEELYKIKRAEFRKREM